MPIPFLTAALADELENLNDALGIPNERIDELAALMKNFLTTTASDNIADYLIFVASICTTNEEFGYICFSIGALVMERGELEHSVPRTRAVNS